MQTHRSLAGRPEAAPARAALALLLALALGEATAHAQGGRYGTIRWRGVVDREAVLAIQGEDVTRRGRRERDAPLDSTRISSPLPASRADVYVRILRGRALVSVDEQPSEGNDWTATVVVASERTVPGEVEWEAVWLDPGPRAHPSPSPSPQPLDTDDADGPPIERFTWSGYVDGRDVLVVRGREVEIEHHSGREVRIDRQQFSAALPEREVRVTLTQREGRGTARITQQPEAANDWTLRVRLDDPAPGEDYYRVDLTWLTP